VIRYHSLTIAPETLPASLEVTATTADGTIMAVRHRALPLWGVQFHPESILTESGKTLLQNFLDLAAAWRPATKVAWQTTATEVAGARAR